MATYAELMLLGFISFVLSLSQGFIVHICIPETATLFMLPCKRENHKVAEEGGIVCKKKVRRTIFAEMNTLFFLGVEYLIVSRKQIQILLYWVATSCVICLS